MQFGPGEHDHFELNSDLLFSEFPGAQITHTPHSFHIFMSDDCTGADPGPPHRTRIPC